MRLTAAQMHASEIDMAVLSVHAADITLTALACMGCVGINSSA